METSTTVAGQSFILAEATAFDLKLPQFSGQRSDYIVYTVTNEAGEMVGYLVKGFHTADFTGITKVYWRTGVVGSSRLTAGVTSRAAALKRRFTR